MSASVWVPGLVVLVLGIGAGLWLAVRRAGSLPEPADRAGDLERRRDRLYARLRELRAADEADPEQIERLEREAAQTLAALDAIQQEPGTAGGAARPVSGRDAATPGRSASQAPRSARAGLIGFASGVGATLLVGGLILSAIRSADENPQSAGMGAGPGASAARPMQPASPADADRAHQGGADLSPQAQAEIAALRERLAADPEDYTAVKQLAVLLLSHGQLVEAFELSETLLAAAPDDPDGLYVQGVVRLAMGQNGPSIELLDRVLAQYPQHVLALLARGRALERLGRMPEAIADWERALEVAGGSNPQIESMIAEARADSFFNQPSPSPPPSPRVETPAAAPTAASNAPYKIRIELAGGAAAPAGSTLFVALRSAAGSPPVAVQRVPQPRFPLEVTLGPEQSMMGQSLPAAGSLSVRLDADGSASTQQPGDLSATVEAEAGKSVTLVLGS